ncbi:hypothetical protein TNCT_452491 [Trichonephila clavata]|uniref:Uncharacterized protein n=1 Tax=Trichonephila clavata TaxID=2740835 RepID=A0A8X6G7A2_TRICU|nr:hypothetical protein TNCT_452491 [Trichonephila clavata]
MARQRGLVHIQKSSLASALDRARQHVMGVSPPSSLEESSGGYTGHVRKVWEFGVWGGAMELEVSVLLPKMETNIDKIVLPPTEKNGLPPLPPEAANFS